MPVPYTFGTRTSAIPLSELDANFNTPVTIGNTTVGLGNTVTSVGNLTLTNVTITSGTINASVVDSGYTANAVIYANSTGVLTDGSANLTFNGTTLTAAAITSTGVATFSAGTVSAPAITTTGDTNTGIFFPAADTIAFTEGGVESMRIDSSGNVGINTTSPGVKLGVVDTSAGTITFPAIFGNRGTTNSTEVFLGLQTYDSGTAGITNGISSVTTSNSSGAGSADLKFWTTNAGTRAERMRIDSSGNVSLGGAAATARLYLSIPSGDGTVNISGDGTNYAVFRSQGASYYQLGSLTSIPMTFITNGSERMRITSDGNLLIGSTANDNTSVGNKIQASGGAIFVQNSTGDGPLTQFNNINASIANGYRFASFRINSGATEKGTITYNTGTGQVNYNQTSDRRLKTNIKPAKEALSIVSQIKVVSFDMLSGGHTEYGVIAQDLKDIFPEAVSEGDSEKEVQKAWGVDTSNLVPALVKAIQEQQTMIEELKQEVAKLKGV